MRVSWQFRGDVPDGHLRQGGCGIGLVLSLLGLFPGSSPRKGTVGFEQGEVFFLGTEATTQRFAVAFNDGEKEGFHGCRGQGKKLGW